MRRSLGMGIRGRTKRQVLLAVLLASQTSVSAAVWQSDALEAARRAYESSDYSKAVLELQAADAAITSAERAVAIDPKSSVYHEWLGRAYGEKAEHSSMFSALGLARKTHREFEVAVELDEKNFPARQALIEYYCEAPGMVGGGEEKAKPEIQKLQAMDASEGHFAAGVCRKQKKDFAAADAEFKLALESQPKRADLIYDIGDYAMRHGQA